MGFEKFVLKNPVSNLDTSNFTLAKKGKSSELRGEDKGI
jgi:hypothetical protein